MENTDNQEKEIPATFQMYKIMTGYAVTQAIYVAASLGIADLLKNGPKSINFLATASDSHAPSLYRVMRLLAGENIFMEKEPSIFALTPLAQTLITDNPDSVREGAILIGIDFHWNLWGKLLNSVKTGQSSFEHIYGTRFFEYMSKNPEYSINFDHLMTFATTAITPAILEAYDFADFKNIVDLGGGQGVLLAEILKKYPSVTGVLYDQKHVINNANFVKENEISSRCEIIEGDFFDQVPQSGDLYILKNILHDWDDQESIKILKNCQEVMSQNSRLIIIETIIPEGNVSHHSKYMDLNMMVLDPGGRERTEKEFKLLLNNSGLVLNRVINTNSPLKIIEGLKN